MLPLQSHVRTAMVATIGPQAPTLSFANVQVSTNTLSWIRGQSASVHPVVVIRGLSHEFFDTSAAQVALDFHFFPRTSATSPCNRLLAFHSMERKPWPQNRRKSMRRPLASAMCGRPQHDLLHCSDGSPGPVGQNFGPQNLLLNPSRILLKVIASQEFMVVHNG